MDYSDPLPLTGPHSSHRGKLRRGCSLFHVDSALNNALDESCRLHKQELEEMHFPGIPPKNSLPMISTALFWLIFEIQNVQFLVYFYRKGKKIKIST